MSADKLKSAIADFKENLKGNTIKIHSKDYADVAFRVGMLRKNLGLDATIKSELLYHDDKKVIVRSEIWIDGKLVSTGLAEELKSSSRINQLSSLLKDIAPFAKDRIGKIKESLSEKLSEIDSKNIDENRFEQELIYYLEKQDITEEQVRLSTHLNYFLETMKTDSPNGKKLGFISQEIGREVNTIGSKSSDAEMQKIVVQMKDELEKIKEQLLNIL